MAKKKLNIYKVKSVPTVLEKDTIYLKEVSEDLFNIVVTDKSGTVGKVLDFVNPQQLTVELGEYAKLSDIEIYTAGEGLDLDGNEFSLTQSVLEDILKAHTHSNKSTLDGIQASDISNWDEAYSKTHVHANKSTLDSILQVDLDNWNEAHNKSHTHANKTILDGISSSDIEDWEEAYDKKVNAISFTGDTNKTLTVTREDGSILTASFLDNNDPQFPDDVLNTLTFNDNNDGVLRAITSEGSIIDVSLDGRYSLLGHKHVWEDITDRPTSLSDFTNDLGNYGNWITKAQGDTYYSAIGHTHTFASLTSKPTTIGGYGITDFNSLGDARWALRTRTITGTGGLTGGGNLTANRTLDLTATTKSDITKGVTAHGWGDFRDYGLGVNDSEVTNDSHNDLRTGFYTSNTGTQNLPAGVTGNAFILAMKPREDRAHRLIAAMGRDRIFWQRDFNGWQDPVEFWHSGNLTDVSQLTNDVGYITDTPNLQQVTDIGSSTTKTIEFGDGSGTLYRKSYYLGAYNSSNFVIRFPEITTNTRSVIKINASQNRFDNSVRPQELLLNIKTGSSFRVLSQSNYQNANVYYWTEGGHHYIYFQLHSTWHMVYAEVMSASNNTIIPELEPFSSGVPANAVQADHCRLAMFEEIPSLTGYATESWVNSQSFSTQTLSSSTSNIISGSTVQRAALTGDVTASQNSNVTTIANSAVTHAKYQNIATQRILGRGATGTGNVQELTLGSNLSLSTSGVLSATNTTYSAGTLALLNAGTDTTNRLWSSKILSDYINQYAGDNLGLQGVTDIGNWTSNEIEFRVLGNDMFTITPGSTNSDASNAAGGVPAIYSRNKGFLFVDGNTTNTGSISTADYVPYKFGIISNTAVWGNSFTMGSDFGFNFGYRGPGNISNSNPFVNINLDTQEHHLERLDDRTVSSNQSITQRLHFPPEDGTLATREWILEGDDSGTTPPTGDPSLGVVWDTVYRKYRLRNNFTFDHVNKAIDAVDTKYTAGSNVSISSSNVISATNTTYSAGSLAHLIAGTQAANMVWSAKNLSDYVESKTEPNQVVITSSLTTNAGHNGSTIVFNGNSATLTVNGTMGAGAEIYLINNTGGNRTISSSMISFSLRENGTSTTKSSLQLKPFGVATLVRLSSGTMFMCYGDLI